MLFSEPKIPQSACGGAGDADRRVSVLFSEPKIPQICVCPGVSHWCHTVSVLFSEPKIPQTPESSAKGCSAKSFSALQRAENSSNNGHHSIWHAAGAEVSVLFSEPKIPQTRRVTAREERERVSVLFSEPKIPQNVRRVPHATIDSRFSALQRAENSSNPTLAPASIHISDRDDHASSFLSLPGASP